MSTTHRHRPPSPASLPRTRAVLRAFGQALRGLAAAALLAALIGGLPWGLVHFIGWPLPDHIPLWDEVQATLLNPMSTSFLLNFLACVLWPLWAKFTGDVALCLVDLVKSATSRLPRRHGPLHALAGVLVGAVLLSVVGSRGSLPAAATSTAVAEHASPAITAPAVVGPAESAVDVCAATTRLSNQLVPVRQGKPATEKVRPPRNGIHDSLSRIADRRLGAGDRWPEIWELNKYTTQKDGRKFSNPHLIHPGWILRIPTPALAAERPQREADRATEREDQPRAETPPPRRGVPDTPPAPDVDPDPGANTRANPDPGTAVSVATGAFVGLGLAALITIALMTVRLWQRRTYRPGSGDRDGTNIAPVVRALRIAHDHATLPHDEDGCTIHPTTPADGRPPEATTRARARETALAVLPADTDTVVGVRDGHAIAVDLARTRGLGLVGPGAIPAARALVVGLLAPAPDAGPPAAQVLIPAADVETLLGEQRAMEHLPARLRVVEDLDAALDEMEAELLTRTRSRANGLGQAHGLPGRLVLVATATEQAERRLQAILDNGSTFGFAGVLFDHWKPGGTASVWADGTVVDTSPNLADTLAGTRLFTLPGRDTGDLLDLLGAAEETDPPPSARKVNSECLEISTDPYDAATARTPRGSVAPTPPQVEVTISARAPDPEHRRSTAPLARESPNEPADESPDKPARPITLCVLGRPHLYWRDGDETTDLVEAVAPKQREILISLALHRDGVRREALTAAIWPDAPAHRPYNAFHATLSQMRKAVRECTSGLVDGLVLLHDGYYGLNTDLVSVDLWSFEDALRSRRHARDATQRRDALERAVRLYRGDLGEAITSEWLEAPREALRRDMLDAVGVLIGVLTDEETDRKLILLEQALTLDPYNEAIYRDIARAQTRLGRYDALPRTLNLLTDALAGLDERPGRDTLALFESLQRGQEPSQPAARSGLPPPRRSC